MLAARREEIDFVHSEGVYEIVPMQECQDAGMKPWDLIWGKIRSRLCSRNYRTKKQGKIQRAPLASQLFSAMPPLEAVKVLVPIMMSVGLSNKGKPLKLGHYDINHISKEQPRDSFTSDFPQRMVRNIAKTKLAQWSRACMELKMLPASGNSIM